MHGGRIRKELGKLGKDKNSLDSNKKDRYGFLICLKKKPSQFYRVGDFSGAPGCACSKCNSAPAA
jgi:hypothetical protein